MDRLTTVVVVVVCAAVGVVVAIALNSATIGAVVNNYFEIDNGMFDVDIVLVMESLAVHMDHFYKIHVCLLLRTKRTIRW